jgi:hypothetical protein
VWLAVLFTTELVGGGATRVFLSSVSAVSHRMGCFSSDLVLMTASGGRCSAGAFRQICFGVLLYSTGLDCGGGGCVGE